MCLQPKKYRNYPQWSKSEVAKDRYHRIDTRRHCNQYRMWRIRIEWKRCVLNESRIYFYSMNCSWNCRHNHHILRTWSQATIIHFQICRKCPYSGEMQLDKMFRSFREVKWILTLLTNDEMLQHSCTACITLEGECVDV